MIPPPSFTTIEEAREWAHDLWLHYKYPDSFQPQYLELQEIDELSAPEDSRARIQLIDAGSGLSQFIMVFPSGSPVVVAKENTDLYNLYEDADALAAVSANWPYLLEADASGNLTLTGNLVAVGGTFSGSLVCVGGTFSGNIAAVGGTFSGNIAAVNATLTGEFVYPVTSTDTVADPPTEAELDALWSSPSDGFQALLWDETASKMYIVTYDGTNSDWYYVALTKAA